MEKNHTRFLARSRVAMQVRMKKYPWNELLSHRRNMSKTEEQISGKKLTKNVVDITITKPIKDFHVIHSLVAC